MENRGKLHRIAYLMAASLLFSLAACATPATPGSLLAMRQEAQFSLYKQCMRSQFMQVHPSSTPPLRYVAAQCQAWAQAKAFSR